MIRDAVLPVLYGWLLDHSLLLVLFGALTYGAILYYVTFLAIRRDEHVDLMDRYVKLELRRRYHRE